MTEQQRAYILEHGVKVEGIGTMMNLSDVPNMNTNERLPLLSDEQVMDARSWPPEQVREFYEDLITTGKLRVVEEVESVPTIQGVTMSAKCSVCGLKPLMFNFAYCPRCGNKIKR